MVAITCYESRRRDRGFCRRIRKQPTRFTSVNLMVVVVFLILLNLPIICAEQPNGLFESVTRTYIVEISERDEFTVDVGEQHHLRAKDCAACEEAATESIRFEVSRQRYACWPCCSCFWTYNHRASGGGDCFPLTAPARAVGVLSTCVFFSTTQSSKCLFRREGLRCATGQRALQKRCTHRHGHNAASQ